MVLASDNNTPPNTIETKIINDYITDNWIYGAKIINLLTWKILFIWQYKILMSDWLGNTIENIIDNNYINDNTIDGKKILDYSLKYFKMNPQNPYILFGSNNINSAIECKVDNNYIATWANIDLWKLTIGGNKQAIIWNGTTNTWKYIYDLVDSTNQAFLNLNYILDSGYKDARLVLHTNTIQNSECEFALVNNINYARGFF